jgi:type IV secretory pathway VirB10-like protein
MNKLYRLPLRTRGRNVSSGVRRRQNSSKILATGIIAFCALAALVAIGFAAVFTFKHLSAKPKTVVAASPSPSTTPSAATPATKDVLMPLVDPNQTPSEASASAHAAISPQPSPPVPVPTVAPTPAASPTPQQEKTDSQPKESDKALTKGARKNLEKKRLEAERKRARLEKMYQNHEISIDAYNKGKEEYKEEIQKYRTVIKSGE